MENKEAIEKLNSILLNIGNLNNIEPSINLAIKALEAQEEMKSKFNDSIIDPTTMWKSSSNDNNIIASVGSDGVVKLYLREFKNNFTPIIYTCPHSGEEFREGEVGFGIYCDEIDLFPPNDYTNFDGSLAYFHDKQKAKDWNKAKFEKKPLFVFENHNYFEGDKCWYFDKNYYRIDELLSPHLYKHDTFESCDESKIYPSEELCKMALNEWIWENHLMSAMEMLKMAERHAHEYSWKITWENYYCEQVIKQIKL